MLDDLLEGLDPSFSRGGHRLLLCGPGGERLLLNCEAEELSLGRQWGNDLVLRHPSVSRKHAQIRLHQGRVQVRDQGSSHGTWIEGRRLGGGQWVELKPGQVVRLGDLPLRLERLAATEREEPDWRHQAGLCRSYLERCVTRTLLDSAESYLKMLQEAGQLMRSTGGIIDLDPGLPTLIIPDLHGRRDYLLRSLNSGPGGPPLEGLARGLLQVLCLGDGMHGERRVRQRWLQAEEDFRCQRPSVAMEQEAVESLGVMQMVMELKIRFPDHFHYLRGNHDEVTHPQRSILKYTEVGESHLFRHFLGQRFGAAFVDEWAAMELSMPLLARGAGFVASHAAPGALLTRAQVMGRHPRAFERLGWTNNLSWSETGPEGQMLRATLSALGCEPGCRWIVGHCKVDEGLYRSQLGGQLIQINPRDPNLFVVALVPANREFRPEQDIFALRGG